MKINVKYLIITCGILLAATGFLPLLSKNGVAVNGFQPGLGMGVGFWMAGLGGTVALLGFAAGRWAPRINLALSALALLLALNTCWQGYKLGALAWGSTAMTLVAAALLALSLTRLIREK